MRRCIAHLLFFLFFPSLSSSAEVAIITGIKGEVTITSNHVSEVSLQPFVKVSEGETINLNDLAELRLIFLNSGKEESWKGTGRLQVEPEGAAIKSGTPSIQVRTIPLKLAKQIFRSPTQDLDGRVGLVRVRSIPTPEALAKLDSEYKKFRDESELADRAPELFLLSGLFELREFYRLEIELERLAANYPDDLEIRVLRKLYMKAIAEVQP